MRPRLRNAFGCALATASCVAVAVACGSFDEGAKPAVPDDAAVVDAAGPSDDAVSVVDASACTPDPMGPVDAGPEDRNCDGTGLVDLSVSKDHCGFCGNSCGAANACVDGACVGEAVATGFERVVVSGAPSPTDLWFAENTACDSARVRRLPLTGGPAQDVFTTVDGGCIDQVDVRGDQLFYLLRNAGIHAGALEGLRDGGTLIVAGGGVGGYHLTSTSMFVRSVYGDRVTQRDLDGKNPSIVQMDPTLDVQGMHGDDDGAWWVSTARGADAGTGGYKIWMRANTGGSTVERASGTASVSTFLVDSTHVFFGTRDGEVYRLAKAGGAAELVTKIDVPAHNLRALAFAGDYVFIVAGALPANNNGDVSFYRAKKCGGRARLIARDYMYGNHVAVIGKHLYFGRVSALARLEIGPR